MTKIFKHLAKHWAACLVIIALLLVQAYGDLTLPDYTSKIVDTGIQQSGIADAVPEVVRDSTLQVLELLMTVADAAAVCSAGWSAFLPLKRTSFPPHPSSPAPPTMCSRSR